jgi:Ca2+-binding RTX toxin-like protein
MAILNVTLPNLSTKDIQGPEGDVSELLPDSFQLDSFNEAIRQVFNGDFDYSSPERVNDSEITGFDIFIDGLLAWSFTDILYSVRQYKQLFVTGDATELLFAEADQIFGSGGDDELYAFSGDDLVEGDGGNDLVYGGQGNDEIRGGEGADLLYGDEGDDFINGNQDNDFICGCVGNDSLYGGRGLDQILGESGDDLIVGGEGDDFINGNADNDTVSGGLGDDDVRGGRGNDVLDGQSGNDSITGAVDADLLTGGAGDDTFFTRPGASPPPTASTINVGTSGENSTARFEFDNGVDIITDFDNARTKDQINYSDQSQPNPFNVDGNLRTPFFVEELIVGTAYIMRGSWIEASGGAFNAGDFIYTDGTGFDYLFFVAAEPINLGPSFPDGANSGAFIGNQSIVLLNPNLSVTS